ncbi:MAG: hypothetical protein QOG80_1623 [Pseudonocardiales bacterium]|nr:hypothetical protein [Pseudonocardiales bacterium]
MVIVHDYVTQRGGAERVVLDLLRAFPGAPLLTSCWHRAGSFPEFEQFDVRTLWPDRIGLLRRDPRRAFPVLAAAFGRHVVDDADVVICSSSGWSHRVRTAAPKVVYCHNPARWLYQPDDYLAALPPLARRGFVAATRRMQRTDVDAAHDAVAYAVNSSVVAQRVRDAYGIDPSVVPPARGLSPDGPTEPVPGVDPGYWLTIGRARGYKNTDVVCEAVAAQPGERLVVVGGLPAGAWPANIAAPEVTGDAQLRWLYANAVGLVAVAHEDFGLTPVEAQAFGIPVVALRAGGYLDSTIEGVTGVFVDAPEASALIAGMQAARSHPWDADAIRRAGERYSPTEFAARMHTLVTGALSGSQPQSDPRSPGG